jgi:predicted nucleotidyltransferase
MLTEDQKNIILQNLKPLSPGFIGIFGSYARAEENPESDIDILIDPLEQINLLDIIGAEQTLTELLQKKVDVVTVRSLSPYMKDGVMRDVVRIG